jgi:serine/threonine protein kinase
MAYRKNIKNSSVFLNDYEILEENRYSDTYVQYLVHNKRDPNTKLFISRETIEKSAETLMRIEVLIKCKELGIIIANEIFIEQINSMLLVYTVTPSLKKVQSSLRFLINSDALTSSQKVRIFQNLANSLSSLHDLGNPYLELSPDTVIVENKSIVYLRPFKIQPDIYAEDFYYASPEVLSGIPYFLTQPLGDVWSLGAIYAELFVSLTPLFQAPSPSEKLLKMFEVLGIPIFQDVEDYITWENYQELKSLAKQTIEPVQELIFNTLPHRDKQIITSMLCFSIEKRVNSKTVANFVWNNEDNYSIQHEDIHDISEDFSNNTKIISDYSSFRINTKENRSDYNETNKFNTKDKINDINPDNTLSISIHSGINLNLYKYDTEDYYLSFSFELETPNKVYASTEPIKASSSISINYKKDFPINSEDFKKHYRTNPLIIKVSQCLVTGDKKREDTLGICEAYLGLLFSSSNTIENTDSSVYGWYHITSGKGILGQLLLEIRTKISISKAHTISPTTSDQTFINSDTSLIKNISQDMGNLTAQLRERSDLKVKREQE